jgi:N utilization substance protein A
MVKNVVRIPGEKQKVAETYDDRIDPVGACVGMKVLYSWYCS